MLRWIHLSRATHPSSSKKSSSRSILLSETATNRPRRVVVGTLASALLVTSISFLSAVIPSVPPAAAAGTLPTAFGYTGSTQTWGPAPSNETIEILAVGASGGADYYGGSSSTGGYTPGGLGGAQLATINVTSGETLTITVGGVGAPATAPFGGAGGYGGGANGALGGQGAPGGAGGGGGSSIANGSTTLVEAGGGGGAGGVDCNLVSSACTASASSPEFPDAGGAGGAGGGSVGTAGSAGQATSVAGGGGGGGGNTTTSSGGAAGSSTCSGTQSGGSGSGGGGGGSCYYDPGAGGGGGGGYYGGGGGGGGGQFFNAPSGGGGGGGGSSYAASGSSNVHSVNGSNPGKGFVVVGTPGSLSLAGMQLLAAELAGGSDPSAKTVCNCSVGGPIALASGSQWLTRTDLQVLGRIPLAVSENYSTGLTSVDGPLGFGWTWNYGMSLTNGDGSPLSGTPSVVGFNEETGSADFFTNNGSSWAPPSWVQATLNHNGDGTWTLVRDNTLTFKFNAGGQMISESDLNGDTITLAYTSSTIVITDPAGRTLTASLNSATPPQITSITESGSPARSVQFSYDANGNLTSITDPNGGVTSYGYDSSHRLVEERSPRYYAIGALPTAPTSCTATPPADITSTVYDSSGRAICQWDPDGRQTTFSWVDDGLGDGLVSSATVTDPKGNVTAYSYLGGLLVSKTEGYGTSSAATWSYAYDPISGGITTVVDPKGHTATATFDAEGNELSNTNALGQTTTRTYNSLNEITSITPPATYGSAGTVTTTYSYDESAYSSGGAGNLTTVSTPILSPSGTSLGTQVTHYVHSNSTFPGDVTSMIDPDGNTWTYTYDSYGDRISQTAPATSDNSDSSGSHQNVTKWAYDPNTGLRLAQLSGRYTLAHPSDTTCSTPATGCTTYTYDAMGHVLVTTDGNGHYSTNHYDADGNVDYAIDANSQRTNFTYDPAEQLTQTQRADTTSTSTNYWPDGTVKDQINASSGDTHYTYDALGHVSSITDPDSRATGYQYDAVGNLIVKSDPGVSGCTTASTTKGCTIYSYDVANELIATTYNDPATPNVTDSYDADGRRMSMSDGTGTSTWAYDSLGRASSTTNGAGATAGYTYDAEGNKTAISYPGGAGSVSLTFDAEGREQSVSDWLGHTTNYTYDADGNLTSQSAPATSNPVVDTYTYDPAGVISGNTTTQGSTTDASFTYTNGAANQLTAVTSSGVPSDTHTYGYNQLNQLTTTDSTTTEAYDNAGNPTQIGSSYQGFDAAGQLCWTSTTAPGGSASCTSPPSGANLNSYDTRGNRTVSATTSTTQQNSFDEANRLISSTTVGTPAMSYSATVAADSPSAFWQLGESSGTTAADSSNGGSYSGTYQNSPTLDTAGALAGSSAGSVTLNGTNQYVSVPSGFSMFGGSSGFTIEGWVKPTTANSWTGLMDFGNGAPSDNVDLTNGSSGRDLTLCIDNGTNGTCFAAPNVITENVWQYIAAAFVPNGSGGGTVTLYLNGTMVNTGTIGYAPTSVTRTHNYIGKSNWSSAPYFQGSIQDVAIYPSALSLTRIVAHYDVGKYALAAGSQAGLNYQSGVESGSPTAFWQLGESAGTTAADSSSGSANSGTYQNSPTLDTAGAITGSSAGSVTFNGTNQYVSLPSGFSMFGGSSGFTIEGWVKPTAANTWARLVDFGNGSPSDNVVLSVGGQSGTDLTLGIDNGTNGANFVASNVVLDNVWQYVAATFVPNGFGGGTVTLYLNGAVVNTGTIGYAPTSVTRTHNYIGKSNWSSDSYFQGSIQDVAIYSSALSGASILAHYTTGALEIQPTSTFAYNGDGLRMSKMPAGSAGPQQYVYDTTGSVPKVLSDGSSYYVYGADGYPLEMIQGSTVTWYHHDRVGSTRVLTNSSGAVTGTASYTPYGVSTTTGLTTPLGYTGAYADADTSLIYLINRYYDPTTGQFLSVDPLVAETGQPYFYAGDNPVNAIDPNGLDCGVFSLVCSGYDTLAGGVKSGGSHLVNAVVSGAGKVILGVGQATTEVGSLVYHHPRQAAGIALGVAAAATGVGAVVEATGVASAVAAGATISEASAGTLVLGGTAALTGGAATYFDQGACSAGNTAACVGRDLGLVGTATGVISTLGALGPIAGLWNLETLPDAAFQGLGSFSAMFGIGASVFDTTTTAAGASAICRP